MAFCSFCFERHAIAFTTRTVNGENIDEAYCVKCAYQSKIAGVKEQLTAAGINDGNIDEIADKFEMVAAIEKHHEERYKKLLANIHDKKVFSKEGDAVWQCANCGHIVIGKQAPDICPVCDHPQSYFQVLAENY